MSSPQEYVSGAPLALTTLVVLVVDNIYFDDQCPPILNVAGGSGMYCALGARLFLQNPQSKSIGAVLRTGNDIPTGVRHRLESLATSVTIRVEDNQKCTRGEMRYKDHSFGEKSFRFIQPILQVDLGMLKDQKCIAADAFHMPNYWPVQVISSVPDILGMRTSACRPGHPLNRPLFVWEPVPPSCVPDELESCLNAAKLVDVFSPNHLELDNLFGIQPSVSGEVSRMDIQILALRCLKSGIGPERSGVIIIRCGPHGCCIASQNIKLTWLPSYYCPQNHGHLTDGRVVDGTGAGNAFLRSYIIGFRETRNVIKACYYRAVSSSFALEQVGLPIMSVVQGQELWNLASVRARLEAYKLMVED